jgi:hypothetical protein
VAWSRMSDLSDLPGGYEIGWGKSGARCRHEGKFQPRIRLSRDKPRRSSQADCRDGLINAWYQRADSNRFILADIP